MSKISDDNKYDILLMYQDAIDILNDADDEEVIFSEKSTVEPAGFMKTAAKRGLKIRAIADRDHKCAAPFGTERTEQIAQGKHIPLATLKRIHKIASKYENTLSRDEDPASSVSQALMMWGIPASESGIKRTKKWAEDQIRFSEQVNGG